MSNNEFLPLPDNPGCYEELKDSNCYFVDKTEHLKTVFQVLQKFSCLQGQDVLVRLCS